MKASSRRVSARTSESFVWDSRASQGGRAPRTQDGGAARNRGWEVRAGRSEL